MVSLEALLKGSLELACQAQRIDNIEAGRQGILSLSRPWVLKHIEQVAEPLVQLNEEWEYRRLLEVYMSLDPNLVQQLVERALKNENREIQEVGQDFLDILSRTMP